MKSITTALFAFTALLVGLMQTAQAHVAFDPINAYANMKYFATANIPHGCSNVNGDHFDTIKIEIEIPANFTSVRPVDSTFGPASIETDGQGNVTKLTWTKTAAPLSEDSHLYRVSFMGKLPNTPLEAIPFRTTQTCAGGTTAVWEGHHAPKIKVLPMRAPGWNKYTAQTDISENTIKLFFADAEIVWSNGSAYSSNPVTAGKIGHPLTIIPAGTEYWVKY